MQIFALVILILFALVGFVAIFFTTFGTLIIFIGSILYAFLTKLSVLNIKTLLILLALYLLGEALEYVFIIVGAKKFGGSNAAVVGAIIGGLIGAVVGTGFFGIGIIPGTFLGIFLGALLADFSVNKDFVKSVKAGAGGIMGRIGSVAAKVVIAIIMFSIITTKVVNYAF